MKRCEYCGNDIYGAVVVAWEETKGHCSIIRGNQFPKEINGKLRKIYYHKECATK